jgi:hypothetical protein
LGWALQLQKRACGPAKPPLLACLQRLALVMNGMGTVQAWMTACFRKGKRRLKFNLQNGVGRWLSGLVRGGLFKGAAWPDQLGIRAAILDKHA